MKKLTRVLIMLVLSLSLITGTTVMAAPAAQAYTVKTISMQRMYYASPYCYMMARIDYNWYEEWIGYRDFWAFYVNSNGQRALYKCPPNMQLAPYTLY